MKLAKTPWIVSPPLNGMVHQRLFCFPYAGGGAAIFSPWRAILGAKGISVCAVQLPGREGRFREKLNPAMGHLASEIASAIETYLDRPFSFFGHSMGTLLAFEVALELERRRWPAPQWLLMSAAVPPHRRKEEALHTLPESEFIPTIARRFGGVPPEVLTNQDLLELMTPMLRADFELIERYSYLPGQSVAARIAAFGGQSDSSVSAGDLQHWRDLTSRPEQFYVKMFEGDHFFLNGSRKELLLEIGRLVISDTELAAREGQY